MKATTKIGYLDTVNGNRRQEIMPSVGTDKIIHDLNAGFAMPRKAE